MREREKNNPEKFVPVRSLADPPELKILSSELVQCSRYIQRFRVAPFVPQNAPSNHPAAL